MSASPDRLPARETAALRDLVAIAGPLGVSLLLVGATARQLLFDQLYALPTRRATRDLDFGVQVSDWPAFLRLRQAAIDSKHFGDTVAFHKLTHKLTGLPIDLVPFGGLEDQGIIRWPEDGFEMVVTGFDDALEHAVEIEVAANLRIRVVPVTALTALKLFAFADRGGTITKDLDDLLFILEHYGTAVGHDRLYESPLDALVAEVDFDVQYAGALLLGFDLGHTCQPATCQKLLPIVDRLMDGDAAWLTPFVRTYDEEEEQRRRLLIANRFVWLARGLKVEPLG